MNADLNRFLKAHNQYFELALAEIKQGKKRSHWMWYIFPQIRGLGFSETSDYYAIENIEEAREFLKHPELGQNLLNIASELLKLVTNSATPVFGTPDDKKLFSSMTLFSLVPGASPIFQKVLDKFFEGEKDNKTLRILGGK